MIIDIDKVDVVNVRKSQRYTATSSKGTQLKWHTGNMYVKLNSLGYEDVAECLVSRFLRYTDLHESEYVMYFPCDVVEDGVILGRGCYSYDFKDKAYEVSVADILSSRLLPFSIGYDDLRDVLFDTVGFDAKDYIDKILCLDSITRNEDRHFHNISFLCKDGVYRPSPIYDNGLSCLSDTFSYPFDGDFDRMFDSVLAKPFYTDFVRNLRNNKRIVIDVDSFCNDCNFTHKDSIRALRVIEKGLRLTEGIAWERC